MELKFTQSILLYAEVMIPALQDDRNFQASFIKNFKKFFEGLEEDSMHKIVLLVRVIRILSFVYNFRSFAKLSYAKRTKFVNNMYRFPIGKIVAGLTGLRSLVLLSYYGIEEVWSSINYNGPIDSSTNEN